MSLLKAYYYFYIKWLSAPQQAQRDYTVFKNTLSDINLDPNEVKGKRILDIGCGRLFPQPLIFTIKGAAITGIDVTQIDTSVVRLKGLKAKLPQYIYYSRYYSELKKLLEIKKNFEPDVKLMDAAKMHFSNSTFDFVISNAAFEHIYCIEDACSEMHRVMKKGALARIAIHLYPSLTGGHTAVYAPPGTGIVVLRGKPWDHLRRELKNKSHLNKLREHQYKAQFEKRFQILKWYCSFTDPEEYLIPKILKALPEYSKEELLKREITVVLRKE